MTGAGGSVTYNDELACATPAHTVMPIARRFLISGRVQGVGFRHFTELTAISTGVAGWVRNRRDGRVEAVAEGAASAVAAFEAAIRTGPAHAHVDAVEITEAALTGRRAFGVEPTA